MLLVTCCWKRFGREYTKVYKLSMFRYLSPSQPPPKRRKSRSAAIAEQLDAHRKQRQAQHPTLTITDMYNVLEKLRSGKALNAKEQKTHEQGLVSILLQLHQRARCRRSRRLWLAR